MNPLVLFDYIFYRIAFLYAKRFAYVESKEFSGIAILSLIQFTNVLFLLNIFNVKDYLVQKFDFYLFIIGPLFLLLLNYIRYIRLIKFKDLEYRWGSENKRRRLMNSVLIIVYFLLSFYLLAP